MVSSCTIVYPINDSLRVLGFSLLTWRKGEPNQVIQFLKTKCQSPKIKILYMKSIKSFKT